MRGRLGAGATRVTWDEEHAAFFREIVPGHSGREISDLWEERYGHGLTEGQIGNAKARLGVRSFTPGSRFPSGHVPANKGRRWDEWLSAEQQERARRGQFAKGHRPVNRLELLSERMVKGGYWQVKVDPRDARNSMGKWVSRARFVYEREHGPQPEGTRYVHVNHDKADDRPENVVAVPRELYPYVSNYGAGHIRWFDRESLGVAMANARLLVELRRRRMAPRRCATCGEEFVPEWGQQTHCKACIARSHEGKGKRNG